MNVGVLDLTSSSYLGLRHGHAELAPWDRLGTGRPPVLSEPDAARRLAQTLARGTGRAAGVLAASTLHAFVDVAAVLAAQAGTPATALVDAGAYPLGRLGLRAARLTMRRVPHFDPAAVAAAVVALPPATRPVFVVDGLCPGCGRLAPLPELLAAVAARDGLVLVDDTQALGLVGTHPGRGAPYGSGGGGTAVRTGVEAGAPLVVVASLAKAYGVPVAVVTGPSGLIDRVRRCGPSRVHAGGPSAAAIAAGRAACGADADTIARRRRRLAAVVQRFRRALHAGGVRPAGGPWPTQTVPIAAAAVPRALAVLTDGGVRLVAVRLRCPAGLHGAGLAALWTAEHTDDDVDRAAAALLAALRAVAS